MTYTTEDDRSWEDIQSCLLEENRWRASEWDKEEVLIDGVIRFRCGFIQDVQSNLTRLADKVRVVFYVSCPSSIAFTLAIRVIDNEVNYPLLRTAFLVGSFACIVLGLVATNRLYQIQQESLLWKNDQSNIELIAWIRKEVIINDRMKLLSNEPRLRYPPHFLFTTHEIKHLIKRLVNKILSNPNKNPFKKLQRLNNWAYKGSSMLFRKPSNEMISYRPDCQIQYGLVYPPTEPKSMVLNGSLWTIADGLMTLSSYPQSKRLTQILTLLQQKIPELKKFHRDDFVITQKEHDNILDQIAIAFCQKLNPGAIHEKNWEQNAARNQIFLQGDANFFEKEKNISDGQEEAFISPAEVLYLELLLKSLAKKLDSNTLASIEQQLPK